MRSQAVVEFGQPLEEIEAPTPFPHGTEVLIKVLNSGVCHKRPLHEAGKSLQDLREGKIVGRAVLQP
jgi:Zn-dependent alcohol dehydrogenase